MSKSNLVCVFTGDPELDWLLSPAHKKGLPIAIVDGQGRWETTVVLIEGSAGTGKTTLALQIASYAAKESESECAVAFLSLEQPVSSLMNVVHNFGFPEVFVAAEDRSLPAKVQGKPWDPFPEKVVFCRLSPLPLSEKSPDEIFSTRFAELKNIVEALSRSESRKKLFVLDSLNALTGSELTRSQLYQLLALFRSNRVAVVTTLEQPAGPVGLGAPFFAVGSFLADVVLRLTREPRQDYLQSFLEVTKSRVCQQGLGKHLFKTRTTNEPEEIGKRRRVGVVVYPSVHFVVWRNRPSSSEAPGTPTQKLPPYRIAEELTTVLLDGEVARPACFGMNGPAGTHKLALGLNLGIGYVDNKARLLIVAFGGQGDIRFDGVAWTKSQQYLQRLGVVKDAAATRNKKWRLASYSAEEPNAKLSAFVTVLTFFVGVLTPEECIYSIEQILKEAEDRGTPYTSVLLSDTAELCTSFPLLGKDPVFFAALLDLFESKGLVTVGIGVTAEDQAELRDVNLTLMAKASHRLVFRHVPDVTDLMEDRIASLRRQPSGQGGTANPPGRKYDMDEQLVSVVIDNVTGKHYARQPKWVHAEEAGRKELCFSDFEKPPVKRAEEADGS